MRTTNNEQRTTRAVALVFPGQGSQAVGMGKEFYGSSPQAKEVFDKANAVINGLTDVIFKGPQEKLTSTAFCQPAILTYSVAVLKAFQAHAKYQEISPEFTCGLSLGEYSALAASGALSFEETLKLVERRSAFMEEATKLRKGKMAAVIGMDKDKLVEICSQAGAEVANFNSPEQIVITGEGHKVDQASKIIKDKGAKRVIPLDVSGAFHSGLMQPAANNFMEVLRNVEMEDPEIPIISNVDAIPTTNTDHILSNLAKQITSSVQWVDTINYIVEKGVTDFIEIGPGTVLKGLIRKINKELVVYNIQKPEDIEGLML